MLFTYSEKDFVMCVNWKFSNRTSYFDRELCSRWETAFKNGYFRYKLDIQSSKRLEGKFNFFCELNPERGSNRRAPDSITSLTQPFNPLKFNFTKISENEKLFNIKKSKFGDCNCSQDHHIIINVSPLGYGHSLLLPSLSDCLPQLITLESLQLALEIVMLSSTPAFRIGFNSLCAYASVNHLHYHMYYLNEKMLLEDMGVQHLSGPCYELVEYPAKGFVFQVSPDQSLIKAARQVYHLINFLIHDDIAHNVYMTRGKPLVPEEQQTDFYNTVRVYVWARKSSSGAKVSSAFNPAVCELFGHLNIKTEESYNQLTEESVAAALSDLCNEIFHRIRYKVKQLFR